MKYWRSYKIFLANLTFFFVFTINNIVSSESLKNIQNSTKLVSYTQERYQVSQNFLDIKFDENYYYKLIEADRYYKEGNLIKAKQIQREVKQDFAPVSTPLAPEMDAKKLSKAGRKYWYTASKGIEEGLDKKTIIRHIRHMQELLEIHPNFIPGHLLLVDTYAKYGLEEKALLTITRLAILYPELTNILDEKIELLANNEKYLEASITARQFVFNYPTNLKSQIYQVVAEVYTEKYINKLKQRIAISSIVGSSNTDNNKESEIQNIDILLVEEAELGTHLAEIQKQNLTLVENDRALEYVDSIGQKLAKLMGRAEFQYEFYIFEDPKLNVFGLPGGKIFISTGILHFIDSEAELAGVLSHEIAHSVLSHSYKKLADAVISSRGVQLLSNLIGSSTGRSLLQVGAVLLDKELSRSQEKQADILGLRVLSAAGYSADGLYNVMAKAKQLEKKETFIESLLYSHPTSEERMSYLEEIIQRNGYNRYAFEGVEFYIIFKQLLFSN